VADTLTLHGGTPVAEGEKWIATRWMRERPYR
jgi:prolyl 4-hydroxylase